VQGSIELIDEDERGCGPKRGMLQVSVSGGVRPCVVWRWCGCVLCRVCVCVLCVLLYACVVGTCGKRVTKWSWADKQQSKQQVSQGNRDGCSMNIN
jgi:hypothetical protein